MRNLRGVLLLSPALAFLIGCNDGSQGILTGGGTGGTGGASTSTGSGGAAGSTTVGTGGSSAGSGGSPVDPGGTGGTGGVADSGAGPSDSGTGLPDVGQPDPGADGLKQGPFKILVLSTTLGFHHDSIPACIQMLKDLGATSDADLMKIGAPAGSQWTVDVAGAIPGAANYFQEFGAENLKKYEMVYSDNPTGEVFTNAPKTGADGKPVDYRTVFQNYMTTGGAWAGQHSATDFENGNHYAWFHDQVDGAYFVGHDGDGTPATVVTQPNFTMHPIMRGLTSPWNTTDEWYKMSRDVAAVPGFQVLAKVTVSGSGIDPNPRPAIWIRELAGGGRSFYTIRGHNIKVFAEAQFRQLMLRGILWAVHRLK